MGIEHAYPFVEHAYPFVEHAYPLLLVRMRKNMHASKKWVRMLYQVSTRSESGVHA